ncbi:hypothetical protein PG2093B_0014 [Bifidobacterium pseudolongum subsp. globosum]|uniref:Uncharacterized protein n=1 Tax=Bifidobacterium pseudolongum subsp. globosum TaxID=1690 RepID=A0A4Q5A4S6_9BIFI|nr:hypothetical protein PG2093B_0014 [Bifidobacterium pseudolongum subsp. globosum]
MKIVAHDCWPVHFGNPTWKPPGHWHEYRKGRWVIMGLSHRQWRRLIAGTLFSATANALWMWFAFGKAELLSWRGVLGVAVTSALFFLMALWATPPLKSSEDEDEKHTAPVGRTHNK